MSEWIDVNQVLPPDGVEVLVYSEYWSSLPFVGFIDRGQWEGDCILSGGGNVTHWMPLPAPPEACRNAPEEMFKESR